MSEEYFKKALSDFTNDFASGGAIRHLADNGFTVKEIHDRLDFPTPVSKVAETVWKHFLDIGIILLEEPVSGESKEKVDYVKVHGEFGKTSFKRVVTEVSSIEGEYIKCDFGKEIYKDKEGFKKSLSVLSERDRDYILGLPWPLTPVWHIADERMKRIYSLLFSEHPGEDLL